MTVSLNDSSPSLSSPKLPQPIFFPTRKFGPTIRTPALEALLVSRVTVGRAAWFRPALVGRRFASSAGRERSRSFACDWLIIHSTRVHSTVYVSNCQQLIFTTIPSQQMKDTLFLAVTIPRFQFQTGKTSGKS